MELKEKNNDANFELVEELANTDRWVLMPQKGQLNSNQMPRDPDVLLIFQL